MIWNKTRKPSPAYFHTKLSFFYVKNKFKIGGKTLPYFTLCSMVYLYKQKISSFQVSENIHLEYDRPLQMFGSVTGRRSCSFWTLFSCWKEGGGSHHSCSRNLAQYAPLLPKTLPDLPDTTPCHRLTQYYFLIQILRHRGRVCFGRYD